MASRPLRSIRVHIASPSPLPLQTRLHAHVPLSAIAPTIKTHTSRHRPPPPLLPFPSKHANTRARKPGILYADIGVDLSNVPLEDLPLLSLFSRVTMESGTSELDRVQLSRRIGSQTGGVYATFLNAQPFQGGVVADPGALKQYFFLRGKVGWTDRCPCS